MGKAKLKGKRKKKKASDSEDGEITPASPAQDSTVAQTAHDDAADALADSLENAQLEEMDTDVAIEQFDIEIDDDLPPNSPLVEPPVQDAAPAAPAAVAAQPDTEQQDDAMIVDAQAESPVAHATRRVALAEAQKAADRQAAGKRDGAPLHDSLAQQTRTSQRANVGGGAGAARDGTRSTKGATASRQRGSTRDAPAIAGELSSAGRRTLDELATRVRPLSRSWAEYLWNVPIKVADLDNHRNDRNLGDDDMWIQLRAALKRVSKANKPRTLRSVMHALASQTQPPPWNAVQLHGMLKAFLHLYVEPEAAIIRDRVLREAGESPAQTFRGPTNMLFGTSEAALLAPRWRTILQTVQTLLDVRAVPYDFLASLLIVYRGHVQQAASEAWVATMMQELVACFRHRWAAKHTSDHADRLAWVVNGEGASLLRIADHLGPGQLLSVRERLKTEGSVSSDSHTEEIERSLRTEWNPTAAEPDPPMWDINAYRRACGHKIHKCLYIASAARLWGNRVHTPESLAQHRQQYGPAVERGIRRRPLPKRHLAAPFPCPRPEDPACRLTPEPPSPQHLSEAEQEARKKDKADRGDRDRRQQPFPDPEHYAPAGVHLMRRTTAQDIASVGGTTHIGKTTARQGPQPLVTHPVRPRHLGDKPQGPPQPPRPPRPPPNMPNHPTVLERVLGIPREQPPPPPPRYGVIPPPPPPPGPSPAQRTASRPIVTDEWPHPLPSGSWNQEPADGGPVVQSLAAKLRAEAPDGAEGSSVSKADDGYMGMPQPVDNSTQAFLRYMAELQQWAIDSGHVVEQEALLQSVQANRRIAATAAPVIATPATAVGSRRQQYTPAPDPPPHPPPRLRPSNVPPPSARAAWADRQPVGQRVEQHQLPPVPQEAPIGDVLQRIDILLRDRVATYREWLNRPMSMEEDTSAPPELGPPGYRVGDTIYVLEESFSVRLLYALVSTLPADTLSALTARAADLPSRVDPEVHQEDEQIVARLLAVHGWGAVRREHRLDDERHPRVISAIIGYLNYYLPRVYTCMAAESYDGSGEGLWDRDNPTRLTPTATTAVRQMFTTQPHGFGEVFVPDSVPAEVARRRAHRALRSSVRQQGVRPGRPSKAAPRSGQGAPAGATINVPGEAVQRQPRQAAPPAAPPPEPVEVQPAPIVAPIELELAAPGEPDKPDPSDSDESSWRWDESDTSFATASSGDDSSSSEEGKYSRRRLPKGALPPEDVTHSFTEWDLAGKPRNRLAVIRITAPVFIASGNHLRSAQQLKPLFSMALPTTPYPRDRTQWGSAEARTFLDIFRKYCLNHYLSNAQGDRLVGVAGEPDQCISLILHLFPVELQNRIKAVGIEMGDDRAAKVHPTVNEGKCAGNTAMDYLTLRELELIVYTGEGKPTTDEAKRKLKRLRYDTSLTWTGNYNIWFPLVKQLALNNRRTYNSLAVFVDTNRQLHEAMFGRPGLATREVELSSTIDEAEARTALDSILGVARLFEQDQEKLKNWRSDHAQKAKSIQPADKATPPAERSERKDLGANPRHPQAQKRRPDAHNTNPEPSKKAKPGSYYIAGGKQPWSKMIEANPSIPKGLRRLLPDWFNTAARDEAGLCSNCWGEYHGASSCDASDTQKERGRTLALQQRELHRQRALARQEGRPSPERQPGRGTGRVRRRRGGRGGSRGRGSDRGRGRGHDQGSQPGGRHQGEQQNGRGRGP